MTPEQFDYFCKNIDPLYFMGTHPETDTYVFWSLLESPKEKGIPYPAQVYFSWRQSEAHEELFQQPLLEIFKQKARPFFPLLAEMAEALPEDTVVTNVNLVDWPLVQWDNWKGHCILIGDSAHCMVICKSPTPEYCSNSDSC